MYHQIAMTLPPAVRRTNHRLKSKTRRHQRRKREGARATAQTPAIKDEKRGCEDVLIRIGNCMAPVFDLGIPGGSTRMAVSVAQMDHLVGLKGPKDIGRGVERT